MCSLTPNDLPGFGSFGQVWRGLKKTAKTREISMTQGATSGLIAPAETQTNKTKALQQASTFASRLRRHDHHV